MKNEWAKRLGLFDDPTPLQLLGEAGCCWLRVGRPDEAFLVFDGLSLLTPDEPLPWVGMADCRLRQGRVDEALALYEKAAGVPRIDRRGLASTWRKRGDVLFRLGRGDEAVEAWVEASALDPDGDEGRAATEQREVFAAFRAGEVPS